ncbi:6-hydroxymethylpterin diphosphokinase MptE-like protein [Pseudodesulfovibrio sp. zrk46]|uniref:6-hydroxymethylpterin diphosphokinase MptE-like protein n=1 Tax=Pseudodesulfovibrio sp. zrk46 TaxID=2725288 RepID=UPI0014492E7D|nr:6-hydroxymethylpterin diphosphokinase MptE-like protein [Pseudodesulfovibrio sp. zrk46]QJB55733.1 DUF115 domain-containing protein [Pseudodesulfovibrio sp. zrk46]
MMKCDESLTGGSDESVCAPSYLKRNPDTGRLYIDIFDPSVFDSAEFVEGGENADNNQPPQPDHELFVDIKAGLMTLSHKGGESFQSPLSLQTIHALYHRDDKEMFSNGLNLRISRKDITHPLGFEALLQVIMINAIFCVYPRVCSWSPWTSRLHSLHIDAETNFIRNAAYINRLNHVFTLSNRFAGQPILLALPGPSLDIDYIRKHRSAFTVVAAGRACQRLIEAEVYPDVAYIQDVNTPAWEKSFGSLGDKKIPTILIANPLGRIWKYHDNFQRVFKGWNLYPFERDVFPKIEEIAPSTTSGAYSLVRLLGGNPIVIAGNDCGDNVSSLEGVGVPESMTSLPYAVEGDHLIFSPVEQDQNMYLGFGDEFSVQTQNGYIAGAQWLKNRVMQDATEHGVDVYDFSHTRLCQFNTNIRDGVDFRPGYPVGAPALPAYTTNYDMVKYLRQKKSSYGFILRQLEKGIMPKAATRYPHTCVLTGTLIEQGNNVKTVPEDVLVAKENAESLIGHIDMALEQLGE